MDILLALVTGVLVAGASYLMMAGTLVRFLLGLVLISNAVNLIIFVSGRMTFGAPPLIDSTAKVVADNAANSLPQALILTAIVIGFGLFAFTLALSLRAYSQLGTDDADAMREAEPLARDHSDEGGK